MNFKKLLAFALCLTINTTAFSIKSNATNPNAIIEINGLKFNLHYTKKYGTPEKRKISITSSLNHRLKDFPEETNFPPIIVGGSFDGLPNCSILPEYFSTELNSTTYERHHLISSHFFEDLEKSSPNKKSYKERDGLTRDSAPCILLKKDLHEKTGSYSFNRPASTYKEYRELEELFYNEYKLIGVLMLGIVDLQKVLSESNISQLDFDSSPVKNCIDIVINNSPIEYTNEIIKSAYEKAKFVSKPNHAYNHNDFADATTQTNITSSIPSTPDALNENQSIGTPPIAYPTFPTLKNDTSYVEELSTEVSSPIISESPLASDSSNDEDDSFKTPKKKRKTSPDSISFTTPLSANQHFFNLTETYGDSSFFITFFNCTADEKLYDGCISKINFLS